MVEKVTGPLSPLLSRLICVTEVVVLHMDMHMDIDLLLWGKLLNMDFPLMDQFYPLDQPTILLAMNRDLENYLGNDLDL